MSIKTIRPHIVLRGMEGPPRTPEKKNCEKCKGSGKAPQSPI